MIVQTSSAASASVLADWLCLGVHDDQLDPPADLRGTPLGELLSQLLANKDLPTDPGSATPLHGVPGVGAGSVLVFGLGPQDTMDAGVTFKVGVALARRLASKPRGTVAVALPEAASNPAMASALTEGLVVGTRGPGLKKSEPGRFPFERLLLIAPESPSITQATGRGEIVGAAVNLARDLTNTPPAEKTPRQLAARAREVAIESGLGIEVWDLERIRAERFGGLLGVAAGSSEPPAFVVLDYHKGGSGPTLALVGKGVTFDSGGLSLKPTASMEDMKSDMTGAAVVLATMQAAARLGLRVNIRGYLALTENMTGGHALKLGDVLTMRNGKTVEILNTDAEGRLILADALSYAIEQAPQRMIDLATLTGACMVALGTRTAGLFANDEGLATEILAAAERSGERAWRLPLDGDAKEALKSSVADLKNVGGKWGGAITAAKFLEQFVAETRWAHLDIAGPSWNDSESACHDAGGTGCFVRTLISLLESTQEG